MINLELFRVFYTVAKCKSITKAAEELFISQPAVSQAIKSLENQIGGKLFNRVSRGMELTEPGGKEMFEKVKEAIELLDSAEKNFSDMKEVASGSVRIAAAANVINFFLIKYIKMFREKYPNVALTFLNGTSKECMELVKEDKADVGFANLPITSGGVTFTGQTGKVHDVFVASDKFSELFDKEINLGYLSNYPLMMLDSSTMTRNNIDEFLSDHNIKLSPDMEFGSVEILTSLAVNGLGIACVPKEYVLDEIESGKLKVLSVTPSLPTRAIGVVINKQKTYGFAVNEFLKILNTYEETD
ncbi:MAG: LysR family transcriptional regulator [Clostridia bacterium]|nr:LysR family transcriptional regulator [Clostridia bacterium]